MIPDIPAIVLLHGACATVYAVLAAMVLARPPISRTGALLVFACAATAVWAATFALSWQFPLARLVEWLEVGRAAAWYAFILHLYRRSVAANEQIAAAFKTMGLLALLMIVCAPLVEWVAGPASPSFQSFTTALRLGIAVCNVLLLENLYFNTPPESRWHINLLCVALGGMFLYDLVLYADGVLFHRLSFALVEGRAPAIILAAPLIAVAAVRDRRWAVDIHVSRDVVFHTFTLIGSGIFLLAIALIGEVFRHVGSEWGSVAETSLIFAAILAVAGHPDLRQRPLAHQVHRGGELLQQPLRLSPRVDALHRRADRARRLRGPAQAGHSRRRRGGGQPPPAPCSCARRATSRSSGPGHGTCRR